MHIRYCNSACFGIGACSYSKRGDVVLQYSVCMRALVCITSSVRVSRVCAVIIGFYYATGKDASSRYPPASNSTAHRTLTLHVARL